MVVACEGIRLCMGFFSGCRSAPRPTSLAHLSEALLLIIIIIIAITADCNGDIGNNTNCWLWCWRATVNVLGARALGQCDHSELCPKFALCASVLQLGAANFAHGLQLVRASAAANFKTVARRNLLPSLAADTAHRRNNALLRLARSLARSLPTAPPTLRRADSGRQRAGERAAGRQDGAGRQQRQRQQ